MLKIRLRQNLLLAIAIESIILVACSTPVRMVGQIEQQCTSLSQSDVSGLPGVLVLTHPAFGGQTILLDLKTGVEMVIEKSPTFSAQISPNHSLLAYWDIVDIKYLVLDSTGKIIKSIPNPNRSLSLSVWLDDNHLHFYKVDVSTENPTMNPMAVLDLSNDEYTLFDPSRLPNYNDDESSYLEWDPRFVMNPNLQSLIYPSKEDGLPTILWDIKNKSEIARFYTNPVWATPLWSPDGARFVMTAVPEIQRNGQTYYSVKDNLPDKGGYDLYIISEDGTIQRLTYFNTSAKTYQEAYTWSPDGSRIAFLASTDENYTPSTGEVSVVQLDTGLVTQYCINEQISRFIWSPDGEYLGFTIGDELNNSIIYLLDIETGEAWKIEDAELFGWMTSVE